MSESIAESDELLWERIHAVGRSRLYAARVRSYLDDAARDENGNLRPMREVVYECRKCFGSWCRMTDARVLAAEACPYCDGPGRMKTERAFND